MIQVPYNFFTVIQSRFNFNRANTQANRIAGEIRDFDTEFDSDLGTRVGRWADRRSFSDQNSISRLVLVPR